LYWGKVIGTLAGLATLKPVFALLGFLAGHQFDRGFATRFRKFEQQGSGVGRLPDDYVQALFQSMGHVAKSDGRVTQGEIRAARSVMHRAGLSPAQVRKAIHWFDEGKQPGFPLVKTVRQCRRVSARRVELRSLYLRFLLEVALAKERLHQNERALLWTISKELDIGRAEFAQLEAMIRAQKGFRQSPAGDADARRIRQAYRALGIDESATNEEVKTAYRRQMNRNHPDKIASRNPDARLVADAEKRTREIRRAYEMLKARRSIR
jgi:DnaJ like chaperone protein